MTQAVWKLKVVWDHAGTGTVRSRTIHQQIGRAEEKRLSKLNTVEATRLAGANIALKKVMRTCSGGGEITRAAQAIVTGALVAQDLQPTGQDLVGSPPSGQVVGSLPVYVAPTRGTRGGQSQGKIC